MRRLAVERCPGWLGRLRRRVLRRDEELLLGVDSDGEQVQNRFSVVAEQRVAAMSAVGALGEKMLFNSSDNR